MIKILCNVNLDKETKKEIQQRIDVGSTMEEIIKQSNINIILGGC